MIYIDWTKILKKKTDSFCKIVKTYLSVKNNSFMCCIIFYAIYYPKYWSNAINTMHASSARSGKQLVKLIIMLGQVLVYLKVEKWIPVIYNLIVYGSMKRNNRTKNILEISCKYWALSFCRTIFCRRKVPVILKCICELIL